MNLKGYSFTKDWTLFLDRDGVISGRLPDNYVKEWADFSFLDGVLVAMAVFGRKFGRIVIVSNQQGVGKGLMSRKALDAIDMKMKEEIKSAGGRIDASFYCTSLASQNDPDRKPGTGMALKAKAKFPEIDFSKSVMIGDTVSDIEFGKRLGMVTVLINENEDNICDADLVFNSLRTFADTLTT
jgi:D-glycero-D-manno-heptose 1,7-bisphosphate phosphatase